MADNAIAGATGFSAMLAGARAVTSVAGSAQKYIEIDPMWTSEIDLLMVRSRNSHITARVHSAFDRTDVPAPDRWHYWFADSAPTRNSKGEQTSDELSWWTQYFGSQIYLRKSSDTKAQTIAQHHMGGWFTWKGHVGIFSEQLIKGDPHQQRRFMVVRLDGVQRLRTRRTPVLRQARYAQGQAMYYIWHQQRKNQQKHGRGLNVLISGPTECGKTSVAGLLKRFIDTSSIEIRCDEHEEEKKLDKTPRVIHGTAHATLAEGFDPSIAAYEYSSMFAAFTSNPRPSQPFITITDEVDDYLNAVVTNTIRARRVGGGDGAAAAVVGAGSSVASKNSWNTLLERMWEPQTINIMTTNLPLDKMTELLKGRGPRERPDDLWCLANSSRIHLLLDMTQHDCKVVRHEDLVKDWRRKYVREIDGEVPAAPPSIVSNVR